MDVDVGVGEMHFIGEALCLAGETSLPPESLLGRYITLLLSLLWPVEFDWEDSDISLGIGDTSATVWRERFTGLLTPKYKTNRVYKNHMFSFITIQNI